MRRSRLTRYHRNSDLKIFTHGLIKKKLAVGWNDRLSHEKFYHDVPDRTHAKKYYDKLKNVYLTDKQVHKIRRWQGDEDYDDDGIPISSMGGIIAGAGG